MFEITPDLDTSYDVDVSIDPSALYTLSVDSGSSLIVSGTGTSASVSISAAASGSSYASVSGSSFASVGDDGTATAGGSVSAEGDVTSGSVEVVASDDADSFTFLNVTNEPLSGETGLALTVEEPAPADPGIIDIPDFSELEITVPDIGALDVF